MAYTLNQFCADHHALLTSGQPLAKALPQIAEKLSTLLNNPEFVAESFSEDTPPGKRTLHHDADTDVYVLAHVSKARRRARRTATAHPGRCMATRARSPG